MLPDFTIYSFSEFLQISTIKPGTHVLHRGRGWFRFVKVVNRWQVECVKLHSLERKIFESEDLFIYVQEFQSKMNFETEEDIRNQQRQEHDLHHAEKSAEG